MSYKLGNKDISNNWRKSVTLTEACGHALGGIFFAFRTERNLKIQIVIYLIVLILAFWLQLSFLEISILVIAATMVITLEMVNTAVEFFSDLLEPKYSDTVKLVKDVAAGAVMIASAAAIAVGLLLLLPPLILAILLIN